MLTSHARPHPPAAQSRCRSRWRAIALASSFALALLLTGCAGIDAQFEDPQTRAKVRCFGLDAQDPEFRACVQSLEAHGYKRMY